MLTVVLRTSWGGSGRNGDELLIFEVLGKKNKEIELRVLALCYPAWLASGTCCGGGHYANAPSLSLSLSRSLLPLALSPSLSLSKSISALL